MDVFANSVLWVVLANSLSYFCHHDIYGSVCFFLEVFYLWSDVDSGFIKIMVWIFIISSLVHGLFVQVIFVDYSLVLQTYERIVCGDIEIYVVQCFVVVDWLFVFIVIWCITDKLTWNFAKNVVHNFKTILRYRENLLCTSKIPQTLH